MIEENVGQADSEINKPEQSLRISLFEHRKSNVPRALDLSWDQLAEELREPTVCPACQGHDCPRKLAGPLWSPAAYPPGATRGNKNVQGISVLAFDVDHPTEEYAQRVVANVDALGVANIVHGTHAFHELGSFRVILRLERPATPREYPALWRQYREVLVSGCPDLGKGRGVDNSCTDLARAYFMPSVPEGHEYVFRAVEGEPVGLARVHASTAAFAPGPQLAEPVEDAVCEPVSVDMRALRAELKRSRHPLMPIILKGEPLAVHGERDDALISAAGALYGRTPPSIPPEALLEILRPSLGAMDFEPEGLAHWEAVALEKLQRAQLWRVDKEREYQELNRPWVGADGREMFTRGEDSMLAPALEADDRPTLLTSAPDWEQVLDVCERAVAKQADLFQRGGELVTVDRGKREGVIRHDEGTPRIVQLTQIQVRERIARSVRFIKETQHYGGSGVKPARPTKEIAEGLHGRETWSVVRRLVGVLDHPTILEDGMLLTEPGYHEASGLWLASSVRVGVKDRPTLNDARRAKDELLEVVEDFPFENPTHRSSWLAGFLTMLARDAIDGPTPLFAVDSNVRGSGKSLLVDAASVIIHGHPAPRTANTSDDAEMSKRLLTIALEGDRLTMLDNVNGPLGTPALDAALTGTTLKGRLLGLNKSSGVLPWRTVLWATGNNLEFVGDLGPRRVCHVKLCSPLEHPEAREGFRHPDLLRWVREERPRLLSAGLTLLRAFILAERPSSGLRPWGSYEAWSALIRGCLVWLGEADPLEGRLELATTGDPVRNALAVLFDEWSAANPGGGWLTVKELSALAQRHPGLSDALRTLCRSDFMPENKEVGDAFRSQKRRNVGGRCLLTDPDPGKVARWRVGSVTEAG